MRACSLCAGVPSGSSPAMPASALIASGPHRLAISLISPVALLGTPALRPPRRSPGLDPLGICYPLLFLQSTALASPMAHGFT